MTSQSEEENNQHVFLSIVSHELKTPITSIQGFTQAMQRKIDQKLETFVPNPLFTEDELKKHQEHLEMVMRQIKRLTRPIKSPKPGMMPRSGSIPKRNPKILK